MKIERDEYIQRLIDSKDNGLIKIVTGLRRVGKSYLLKTLFKEYFYQGRRQEGDLFAKPLPDGISQ